MEVPTGLPFDSIYPEDAKHVQSKRWNSLLSEFEQRYGQKPEFVARSPGRVNIIGEHIDYSLYECVPMAVTADVLLAVAVNPDRRIRIANTNSEKFPAREFEIPADGELLIDATAHEWSNYFKAGFRGASGSLRSKRGSGTALMGMDILADGTVPAGGGLSSSAAFVCASALATLRANGEEKVDMKELVELAVVSERAVGVNSGGFVFPPLRSLKQLTKADRLDQTASVFAQRDSALLVSFSPSLSATPVQFPTDGPELIFVIAQSLVVSNKHVTAPIHYNLRVVECTLAALFLAKIFRVRKPLPQDASPLGVSLRGFHDAYMAQQQEDNAAQPDYAPRDYQAQLEHLVMLVDDYLDQEEGYSREQIALILGVSVAELDERYTTAVPVRAEHFKLRQRALHVFSEALRVQKFMGLLRGATGAGADADAAQRLPRELGALLAETQESCRDLYECSCPELDQLCEIAARAGSWGGRLTGAGWGGCTVHLVPKEKVDKVKEAWEREYYSRRFPDLSEDDLADAVIVSKPGRGSLVWDAAGRTTVD